MAATFNESQKIDYLWKKVGYAVTKTAESTVKEAFNESIPSPLLYRGDLVWMESDQITGNPPASTTSIIQVYKDGVGSFSPSVECTEDLTAPDNQTWNTNSINWIPTQFGDNYLVQVYVANTGVTNPQTSGTKLFQAGSGRDDTWFFDYQSGVLNFNGANVPTQIASPITGKSVYVVGYQYVGLIGVTNQPSGNISGNTNIGNLNFTDTTISTITTNSNIFLTPNGTGNIHVTTSLTASGNIVANTGAFFIGDGGYLANLNTSGVANGNSNVNIPTSNGNINLTAAGNTTLVVTGTGVNVAGYLTVNGNLTATNITSNVSSNTVTANSANISGNLFVSDTATIGNVRTNNILYANGQPWDLQEAAGSNTQIQYNDGNTNFGASANFTFNQTTNLLTVVGNSQFNNATLGNLATANFVDVSSNLSVINTANVGNIRTNNLLYANGSAWDFGGTPGGSNTQIQFNDSNEFGGSANFTFDKTTSLLTVVGTANVTAINATGNITGNNGIFGNLSTTGPSGDITGANLISTVTLNASGNITAGNANLGNTSIANNVIANTFRMGVGDNEFYQSTVYFATTSSTVPNQLLWSTSLANLSAIDFTIISTDVAGNTRQTAKIAAAVLGTEVVFNEYSGLYINGGVGSFSVNYQAGSPDTIQLVVTPDSTNLTKYNLMIIQYAK
jgi:hypothetical protein